MKVKSLMDKLSKFDPELNVLHDGREVNCDNENIEDCVVIRS